MQMSKTDQQIRSQKAVGIEQGVTKSQSDWVCPPNLSSIGSKVRLQMSGNLSTNLEAGEW